MVLKIRIWLDDIRPNPANEFGIKWVWYTTTEAMIEDLKRYINWGPLSCYKN